MPKRFPPSATLLASRKLDSIELKEGYMWAAWRQRID